ncbi:MAG: hypothetical protein ABEJ72_07205 [Candidatus Aenigmatarchaeota archaeon]
MKQEELEQKVREIFERQGFEVEQEGGVLHASNGKEFRLKVFSSEEHAVKDIENNVGDGEKVFVDEELAEV